MYTLTNLGRVVEKLFYLCTFMHSIGKISADTDSDPQTCGVRQRLWGEDAASMILLFL